MDALLAEAILKLNAGNEAVTAPQAIAVAEPAGTIAEWREAVEQMVKGGSIGVAPSSDSATLFSKVAADARAMKKQYLNDPYRSPAMCNITSYWYYKAGTKEMTVPAQEKDTIAPEDFKQRFSQARQTAVVRGDGFIVGFLEEVEPQGGKVTVSVWHAAFSSRFSEPIHTSRPRHFVIDSKTDKIAWTEGAD